MSQYRYAVALALVVLIGAQSRADASINLKWSTSELTTFADVILTGRVVRLVSGWDSSVQTIYTYVTIDVDEVFKGAVTPGRLMVKQLGGWAGDTGLSVSDQATFLIGEPVLLYLEARPRDGSLYTSSLWQGKWTIEEIGGERVATRYEPAGHRSRYPIDRQSVAAVRAASAGEHSSDARIDAHPIEATGATSRPFVIGLPQPFRFLYHPVVDMQAGGQSGLPGGGLMEIQEALTKWNAAGSSFRFVPGSAQGPRRCATERLYNGRATIVFDDPCGEISNSGGILAIAGVYFSITAGSGGIVNGTTFFAATEGFVINNDSAAALSFLRQSGCFADVQLHELGHVLGLDHSADNTAIMFPSLNRACSDTGHDLGADDIAGIQFIYPPNVPVSPPTAPPTGVQITLLGTASVTVAFNPVTVPGSNTAAPATAYRLDFRRSSDEPIVATLTTVSTRNVIPIPPDTLGAFTVTITPFNAAGEGPASAPVTFIVGGTGCTGPPATPIVSGRVIGGTATVAWPPVPGATSYLLSAGSFPGASNLYPLTNIGESTVASASGLPAGFTAWVRVIAVNGCGQSAPADVFVQ
jgi:hypothetical protein